MLNGIMNLFSSNTTDQPAIINEHSYTKGIEGTLMADAAIAFEDGKIILAVEHDFTEAPNHIEFNLQTRAIHIVQATGDVATLGRITLPVDEMDLIAKSNKIVLVTGAGDDKLLQVLTLKKHGSIAKAKTA